MIRWQRHPNHVTIEIRDEGKPMPEHLFETPVLAGTDAESGRGWHIIREWTDNVSYTRQGDENVLTLTRELIMT